MTYQQIILCPTNCWNSSASGSSPAGLVRIVINTAMLAERQKYLGADPYQRQLNVPTRPTVSSPRPSRPERRGHLCCAPGAPWRLLSPGARKRAA